MSTRRLDADQLKTLLSAITYRLSLFPRAEITDKLRAADSCFHLAKIVNTDGKTEASNGADNASREADQDYSRFQELQNALVREICETYSSEYVTTFLSKSQVFAMTSPKDKQEDAAKFNALFSDQAKRTKWGANLAKVLMDVSKYNLCATDTVWDAIAYYALGRSISNSNKLERVKKVWRGNSINRLDMYNTMFDISVPPEEVSKKGEWAGYVKIYTQVELKKLIDVLSSDDNADLYLEDYNNPSNKEFNIYKTTRSGSTGSNSGNMDYQDPDIVAYGTGRGNARTSSIKTTNWLTHTGGGVTKNADTSQRYYEVFKGYLRLVPSAYGFPTDTKSTEEDDVQVWEVYILERGHILATRVREDAHDDLPIDIGCTDSDSLQHNSSGPAQVAIPYAKLAKQLTDRILAGADRAIGDRGIYDKNMIDETVINSKVPDAKMPLKKGLPPGKKINDYYYSMPYDGSATARLNNDKASAEQAGRQAVGLNQAQQGQFVKGNKTLYEFDQTMENADSKPFVRKLFLENTLFSSIKTKLKINILQYQEQANLTDPETQEPIEINPAELFEASVEFKVIDGLMPSEYVLSPNVQQQLFTMFTTLPDLFQQEYDVPGLVSHILSQSAGINMEQYKLKKQEPTGGQ